MAEKLFHLEIVTPRRTVYSGDVESFSAPGIVGGFQILHSHAPLLSAIGVGEVKLRNGSGQEFRYASSGGFVEVRDNKVVFLAETAERSDEIDVNRAAAAQERARKRIHERAKDTDLDRARVALARAMNRIKAAQSN